MRSDRGETIRPALTRPSSLRRAQGKGKGEGLAAILGGMGSVLVAYSGGVDSSVLLHQALRVLGPERVGAALVRTPLLPPGEAGEAIRRARDMGAERVFVLDLDPLEDPAVAANPADRCLLCKRRVFSRLGSLAAEEGFSFLAEGTQTDDARARRPGRKALAELGVKSPLLEAGLGKTAVRDLARAAGLAAAERPSSPCLATRFPYGERLTREGLERVARAEALLAAEGFTLLRVRSHGSLARVEVSSEALPRFRDARLRERVIRGLKALGFVWVTLDLEGFRSGSMDEALKPRSAFRVPRKRGIRNQKSIIPKRRLR